MSFHLSAEEDSIMINSDGVLLARLWNEEGTLVESAINLNEIIGNYNGTFQWGGNNFVASASRIEFSIEGGGQVPVLRAVLQDEGGYEVSSDLNLAERIENVNGRFEFI